MKPHPFCSPAAPHPGPVVVPRLQTPERRPVPQSALQRRRRHEHGPATCPPRGSTPRSRDRFHRPLRRLPQARGKAGHWWAASRSGPPRSNLGRRRRRSRCQAVDRPCSYSPPSAPPSRCGRLRLPDTLGATQFHDLTLLTVLQWPAPLILSVRWRIQPSTRHSRPLFTSPSPTRLRSDLAGPGLKRLARPHTAGPRQSAALSGRRGPPADPGWAPAPSAAGPTGPRPAVGHPPW